VSYRGSQPGTMSLSELTVLVTRRYFRLASSCTLCDVHHAEQVVSQQMYIWLSNIPLYRYTDYGSLGQYRLTIELKVAWDAQTTAIVPTRHVRNIRKRKENRS
jgi:hypothetical protein